MSPVERPTDGPDSGWTCTLTPDCEFPAGHLVDHPCGQQGEKPGEPCRYCGVPVPDTGTCPACWTTAADAIPEIKALFAEHDISVDVAPKEDR